MTEEENIKTLLTGVSEFLHERGEKQSSGKAFNAFNMAQIGSEETRHSAIIAELLHPLGPFGKGAEPLQAFFRQIGLDDIASLCSEKTSVETEYVIFGRRMDIVISDPAFCVVIENKTVTVDHEQQLADYRNWLNKQPVSHKELLYLTYEGEDAVNYWSDDYRPISYRNHICPWLNECAKISNNAASSIFCQQYSEFIKDTLLGGNRDMDEKIFEIMRNHFDAAAEIQKNFNEMKVQLLDRCLSPVLKKEGFDCNGADTGKGPDYQIIYREPSKKYVIEFGFDHYYFWGGSIRLQIDKNYFDQITGDQRETFLSNISKEWEMRGNTEESILFVKGDDRQWDDRFFSSLAKNPEETAQNVLNDLQNQCRDIAAAFGL